MPTFSCNFSPYAESNGRRLFSYIPLCLGRPKEISVVGLLRLLVAACQSWTFDTECLQHFAQMEAAYMVMFGSHEFGWKYLFHVLAEADLQVLLGVADTITLRERYYSMHWQFSASLLLDE
ncbi:unnamed protein product [Victoria cruziana]